MNKTAVITGAGSGIGYQLALALLASKLDISIIAIGRCKDKLQALRLSNPKKITIINADVASQEGRSQIAEKLSTFSRIDFLVHAAATVKPIASIKNLALADWQHTLQTNLEAPLFLTQMLLEKFSHSRVLFFTSELNIAPVHGAASYCVSKAGQQMLYECFKTELPVQNVVFGMLSPGLVDTPMQADIRGADPKELPAATALKQHYVEGNLISAETAARFVTWLLLNVNDEDFSGTIWDIYDESHQSSWMQPK